MVVLVYAGVLVPLDLFLQCTLKFDGEFIDFWREPRGLGLSLALVRSALNWGLVAWVVVWFLIDGIRCPGPKRVRWVGYALALGLLVWEQRLVRGWDGVCEWMLAKEAAAAEQLEREQPERSRRIELIAAELAALGRNHPWAGEYRGEAEGRETSLWMAPISGFAYDSPIWIFGPLLDPPIPGRTYGSITEDGDRLLLTSEDGKPLDGFYVVPWGERRYLFHCRAMRGLCRDIRSSPWYPDPPQTRPIPLDHLVLLRAGDEYREVSGLPQVPAAYHYVWE